MPRDSEELEFCTKAALALGECGVGQDLFELVARQLAQLVPESLIITIAYDPTTGFAVVRAMAGPEEMQDAGREVAGEPVGQVFPIDSQARQILSEGKLVRVEQGMHQLTSRTWPLELAQRFEARLGIRSVHGQPFSREGDFVGAVAFLSRRPSLGHARLIEAFVRLAAVAIQRQRAEVQLRDSERRFRMLAENSQDVIFRLRLKPTAHFEYVSPAMVRLSGYTPAEIYADARLGAQCLYPMEWSATTLRELPREPVVAHFRRRDGAYAWAEQNFTPTRGASGDIVVIEGIARDITDRKAAEDALVEADRRKTDFLAVLSHELRNPLGAIRNGIYVLGRVEPGGAQAKRAQEVIERQIAHLTRLIDDLLDVARITRGKIALRLERVELNNLVGISVEDHRGTFASAKVDLGVSVAPARVSIYADAARIRQVVDNLLQNAAKFTPPGGRASVSVRIDAECKQAVLRVHNTGAPLSPDVLSHLFEPFVQADRTLDRSKGGLGLGLALVRGVVELHGGVVAVESDGPDGTALTVRLPLDATDREALRPEAPSTTVLDAHLRVLVIEDNEDAANSLREALELNANTVAVAGNGPEGIEMARGFKPDVIVCDIGLPRMNGYDVARELRADPVLKTIALVALSGYGSSEDVKKSSEAGFDRHITKPPGIEHLEGVLTELVRRDR